MATNITYTGVDTARGPYAVGGKLRERVKAVGSASAANDNGTYNATHIGSGSRVIGGAFTITSETVTRGKGVSVTIEANHALGSDTEYFELEGDPV